MASFPLYDTFFFFFTQKSSLFVQLFRKKWEKNWASTKKLFDTPLKKVPSKVPTKYAKTMTQGRSQLFEEMAMCIKNLAIGKSAAEDCILNKFLKIHHRYSATVQQGYLMNDSQTLHPSLNGRQL